MARTWTILVADDDATVRQLSRGILERLGLIVALAADGREAVQLFSRSQADLVLVDANMPHMDGFEVCKKIRKMSFGAQVPIIMVTSMADSDSMKRAKAAGVTEFVTKPVNWGLLGQRIQQLLKPQAEAAN